MYNEERMKASKICRKKKREAIRAKVKDILEHNNRKEKRKLYKSINECTQEFRPKLTTYKNKQGKILTKKQEIISRWRESYKEKLCVENNENETVHYHTAESNIENSTFEEVECVITKLKNHKALGVDGSQQSC